MSLHRTFTRLSLNAMLALALAAPLAAQQTESRIAGRITDTSGAVLPGVTVTITAKQTGAVRTAVTDGDGRYVVTNLSPGSYEVRHRHVVGQNRRQRISRRVEEPSRQRPELRQPDDAGDRRPDIVPVSIPI